MLSISRHGLGMNGIASRTPSRPRVFGSKVAVVEARKYHQLGMSDMQSLALRGQVYRSSKLSKPFSLTSRVFGFGPGNGTRIGRVYSTSTSTTKVEIDDYIQELEDLYAIAKDELEIAAESTTADTIYAASDRISMREAFDDLYHAYCAYADNNPPPQNIETGDREVTSTDTEVRPTTYDFSNISPDIRAEIKRRVGHRIREIENAVHHLEESAKHE